MLLVFFNSTNNKHAHISNNGSVIVHSHIYKADNNSEEKTPFQSHKHTNFELYFFCIMSFISLAVAFIAIFFLKNLEKKKKHSIPLSFIINKLYLIGFSNYRAPPVV